MSLLHCRVLSLPDRTAEKTSKRVSDLCPHAGYYTGTRFAKRKNVGYKRQIRRILLMGVLETMLEQTRMKIASWLCPELIDQRDHAQRLANTDTLTGLANARAFELAQHTAESDTTLAVILFDLNNFGLVNKQHSHELGDVLLNEFATVLKSVCARSIRVRSFRLHGDEFVVLAPVDTAHETRDEIEDLFNSHHFDTFTVSASGTVAQTLALADRILQTRKAQRKGSR